MKTKIYRDFFLVNILFILIFTTMNSSWAAEKKYPSSPITILCGFPPGGSVDIFARVVAKGLEKHFGVPVVVDNKPGASGMIAGSLLANSRPDGYTAGVMTDTVIIGCLQGQATYLMEDFYIMGVVKWRGGIGWYVTPDAPWKTIQEFVDYARKNPGVKYSHPGTATILHIVAENLNMHANLKMIGVPLKGEVETITSILGKHVTTGIFGWGRNGKGLVEAGKLRILMTNGEIDDPSIPSQSRAFGKSVPLLEAGYFLAVPRKTPDGITQVLEHALEKVTEDPEFVKAVNLLDWKVSFIDGKTCMRETIPEKILNLTKVLQHLGLAK